MNHSKWKTIQTQDVSPSPWFPIEKDLVELPDGSTTEYYRSRLADVAMIVAVTKQQELIFVRQYKHGIGEICLELPAGRIEQDNTSTQTAVAELREETGIEVDESELVPLPVLYTEPSKSSVRVFGFLVREVAVTQQQMLEKTERIEVIRVPIAELDELFKDGQLRASDSVALVLYAMSEGLLSEA